MHSRDQSFREINWQYRSKRRELEAGLGWENFTAEKYLGKSQHTGRLRFNHKIIECYFTSRFYHNIHRAPV